MEHLRAVALDVDGVLTDGTFWWGPNGEEFKRFCFADVMGISLAGKAGLIFALISGEDTPHHRSVRCKNGDRGRVQRMQRQGRRPPILRPGPWIRPPPGMFHGRRHQ